VVHRKRYEEFLRQDGIRKVCKEDARQKVYAQGDRGVGPKVFLEVFQAVFQEQALQLLLR
jgi:hypothetical protein